MARASRFFAFRARDEFWIVDENTLQDVPKPRELLIKLSTVEAAREYVLTQNKTELPIVDRCRDRTGWHTPEGRERIRRAKIGDNHPHKAGLSDDHKRKIKETMTGTRVGEFNPMYGRKHSPETVAKIRQKAYERPRRKWCVEPDGSMHLIPTTDDLPVGWQWGRYFDPYKPV